MLQLPSSNNLIDTLKQNEVLINQLRTEISQLETRLHHSIDLSSNPSLDLIEKEAIKWYLTKTKNSRVKTAKALNVTVRTIMNKLKEYRLKGEDL
jgi:transcriptional regulator with PAS, ATPase and Fis domain